MERGLDMVPIKTFVGEPFILGRGGRCALQLNWYLYFEALSNCFCEPSGSYDRTKEEHCTIMRIALHPRTDTQIATLTNPMCTKMLASSDPLRLGAW